MTELFNALTPELFLKIPEGTILLGYRGSIAHNMYVPNTDPNSIDDVDLMGIVIGEKKDYLGLSEWGSRGTKEFWEGKYDCVFYEIKKMFQLLLQGNPNVVSMLWMKFEHYIILTEAGKRIVANKHLFAGKHVYKAFSGYAHHQLQKMETRDPAELRMYMALTYEAKYRCIHPQHKGESIPYPEDFAAKASEWKTVVEMKDELVLSKLASYTKKGENIGYLGDKRKGLVLEHGYDSKNAAHCVRLLRMAGEYLRTGDLIVHRPDAAELLEIKTGKWPLEKIKAHANDLFKEMEEAFNTSKLPEKPQYDKAEELLINILEEHFK